MILSTAIHRRDFFLASPPCRTWRKSFYFRKFRGNATDGVGSWEVSHHVALGVKSTDLGMTRAASSLCQEPGEVALPLVVVIYAT